jgi:hypothetical protein
MKKNNIAKEKRREDDRYHYKYYIDGYAAEFARRYLRPKLNKAKKPMISIADPLFEFTTNFIKLKHAINFPGHNYALTDRLHPNCRVSYNGYGNFYRDAKPDIMSKTKIILANDEIKTLPLQTTQQLSAFLLVVIGELYMKQIDVYTAVAISQLADKYIKTEILQIIKTNKTYKNE